jgi:branched-chain amino acid transport system ATP-binding protein
MKIDGSKKTIEAKARDVLEFVGLSGMSLAMASTLSQGNLKRLEIARALATEPELLMLDEPFGGLSSSETDLMVESIRRLHLSGSFGRLHGERLPIIIIEHKLQHLMKIVDRIIVLNYGTVIADGKSHDVVNNSAVIEAYLGKGDI